MFSRASGTCMLGSGFADACMAVLESRYASSISDQYPCDNVLLGFIAVCRTFPGKWTKINYTICHLYVKKCLTWLICHSRHQPRSYVPGGRARDPRAFTESRGRKYFVAHVGLATWTRLCGIGCMDLTGWLGINWLHGGFFVWRRMCSQCCVAYAVEQFAWTYCVKQSIEHSYASS